MIIEGELSAARIKFKNEIKMLKLIGIFSKTLLEKKLMSVCCRMVATSVNDINFDSKEEIIKNVLGEVMTIGINLPDTKNLLTETTLQKLCCCIENFEKDEKISAAVLHGCGGNFCCGAVASKEAMILGESLLTKLNEVKKPVIGSLNGYVTNFGVYLAIMCDMRVMDATGIAGFSKKTEDLENSPFIYERLLLTLGLSKTLELILTRKTWCVGDCLEAHFISKAVETGCALGQSILLAQNIAFHRPLKSVIKDRSKIFSFLTSKASSSD